MRWKIKYKPVSDERRIRTFFAFLPINIDYEIRWLEKVTIEQEYMSAKYWRHIRFIDKNMNNQELTSKLNKMTDDEKREMIREIQKQLNIEPLKNSQIKSLMSHYCSTEIDEEKIGSCNIKKR